MKVNMKHLLKPRVIMLVVFFTLSFVMLFAQSDNASNIVEGLTVNDIPNDNGTGLEVSWKPLDKDKRIIEYRVYRGVNPDSLFYTGNIEVNVKTGFAGDVVRYSDKSWTRYLDLDDIVNTPGKLEKEEQQEDGSPLFKSIPRDIDILDQRYGDYQLLAGIPYKNLYLNSKRYEKDDEVLAEVNLRKTKVVLKSLMPGKEYFYTVVAVNEARKFYPMAPVVSGIPVINRPEKTESFSAVNVIDTDEIKFEWSLPISSANVSSHNIYALDKDKVSDFESYNSFLMKQQEMYKNQMLGNEVAAEAMEEVKNPLISLYQHGVNYSGTPRNFAVLSKEEIKGKLEEGKSLDDYIFIFSLLYQGPFETFSKSISPKVLNSSATPQLPEFNVYDKENDKGDYNIVSIAKPIVFLTQSTYSNDAETKVMVNYEYSVPEEYSIKNIYFDVYVNGDQIDDVNEFFQDNSIEIDLPENYNGTDEIVFEISFKTGKKEVPKDYLITQILRYDNVIEAFRANDAEINGESFSDFSISVYRKNYFDTVFKNSRDLLATERVHSDFIDYPKNEYVLIHGIAPDRNALLVSPSISVFDTEADESYSVSLFKQDVIDDDTVNDKPLVKKLLTKSAGAFRSGLVNAKYDNKRTYSYKLFKTDGEANFAMSEVYTNKKGKSYFKPVANWFYKDKLPMLLATIFFGFMVFFMINKARRGDELYIRPISGIQEIDNAIGRATEMGRPILFVPGLSGIRDVATLAGLAILGRVAKKAAEYDTKILVPVRDFIVLPIAQETVKEAFYEAGKPDAYDPNSAFFITTSQFAFVAGVNGIMIREETATNFYMGMFWAESLIMTETGNTTGAIQIAGTDAVTQIPFFITTCDYTLIGEELYAASAYLAKEPLMLGTLKAQDYTKMVILIFIVIGTVLSTSHLTFLVNALPDK